ncbi:MAG: glucosylceramidase [Armatimonadetes bacterium]|nr:glucosylceramidase [Armatimonadota bacterium]
MDKGTHRAFVVVGTVVLLGLPIVSGHADQLVFDFESGDLQGWQVLEGRFGQLVSARATFHNQPGVPYNKQGKYFLSTLEAPDGKPNDHYTGVVVSPVFELAAPELSLLVGGGRHSSTYVALCDIEGQEIVRAQGINAEVMQRRVWRVPDLVGEKVFIKVVDRSQGSWGHVTLDDVRAQGRIDAQATAQLAKTLKEAERRQARAWAQRRKQRRAELMSEELLFAEGQTKVYEGEYLGAISLPVGGIGAGSIEINGEAVRHLWHIFNNMSLVSVPDSFFAVRVSQQGQAPLLRALQTKPVGPFAAMKRLSFRGEYPFGWFDFHAPQLPVRVSLETFNPLIPLNERDSAIPCAIYNVSAENTTVEPVEVTFLATQQNAVGYVGEGAIEGTHHPAYGRNRNELLEDEGALLLHMTADLRRDAPGWGDMVLMAVGPGEKVGTAQWEDVKALSRGFLEEGTLDGTDHAGPTPGGRTVNGALAVTFDLKPGEKRTASFVLTWHFPNARHGQGAWGGFGNRYEAWWSSALEVARELERRLPELTYLTRLYHDSFYESNLPHWLLDRISSQVVVLRSTTCFWTREGYFGGWEGCSKGAGCCFGNCSHVWHYAQAHARLFPAIAKAMREEEFAHQRASGLVPFRQGSGAVATDAQCAVVLNSYREHLMSPDDQWLKDHWPLIRAAMDGAIAKWDSDEDGCLAGPQHNTLDGELGGNSSWLGSLYLAALAAAERMAILQGEEDVAARYRRIRQAGQAKQNEELWNGEYYQQIPEDTPLEDYGTGCHIDQVLGQWWAHQLDLGPVYPHDRVRTALQSLVKYNFRSDFHGIEQLPRKFVADDDAGMQMITWPKGGRPEPPHVMRYADEVMSGFEYSAAATMIQEGLLREGFAVLRAAYERYDGRLRTGLTEAAWGYSGNPFCDDECGKFYARPMSIWSVLLACQGFVYDGPAGRLGFRPVWRPEDHRSFFTTAESWGVFSQRREGDKQTERIEVRYGTLRVKTLVFEVEKGRKISQVKVQTEEGTHDALLRQKESEVEVVLRQPLAITSADVLIVELK